MKWNCRWPECERWAQSNGYILCSGHFKENEILLRHHIDRGAEHRGAEALAHLRNDLNAAPAENDQPMDGPPFAPLPTRRRQRRRLAEDESLGVGDPPTSSSHQPPSSVPPSSAPVNATAVVVVPGNATDAERSHPPPSSVPPSSTPVNATAVAVAANAAHDGINQTPHELEVRIAELENATDAERSHPPPSSVPPSSTPVNATAVAVAANAAHDGINQTPHEIEVRIAELERWRRDMHELEVRVAELEQWRTKSDFSFGCTSVFESSSQTSEQQENTQEQQENGQEDERAADESEADANRIRRGGRGKNPHHQTTATQHSNHTENAGAQEKSTRQHKNASAPSTETNYYREFKQRERGAKEQDLDNSPAHAGLVNCSQICYSNAIFQGFASCNRVSQFFRSPPSEHDKRFPLYHAFASIMNSILDGRETVVDPSAFINLFKRRLPAQDMLDDAQEDEQEGIHEDAHEYLGDLERCLLDELKQKEDGSSDTDYNEELYTKMKTLWQLFSGGKTTITITCTSCKQTSTTVDRYDALLLCFPERHHVSDQDCTLEDLLEYHSETSIIRGYECDICNKRMTWTKETAITNCPTILCIVLLERKKNDGRIITSSVNFPVSGLVINDLEYNLVGTVHHKSDGPDHGHYTSICQARRSPVWYNYDDDKVSQIQFVNKQQKGRVLKKYTRPATILFYELQTKDGNHEVVHVESSDTDGSTTESR